MAYRFTNTEKWADNWFSNLKQFEMLLFLYLIDNCDIAGFIEINYRRWASDLNSSQQTIEGALKGLERGLILSLSNDCLFIKNFIKHQKNLPLNPENKAHAGILKRFEVYKEKFNIENIELFINGSLPILNPLPIPIPIPKGLTRGFEAPSIDEVKAYCKERNNTVSPETFINFYQSKNWMVGKNKMKDWKACVRTWEGKERSSPSFNQPKTQQIESKTANQLYKTI